MFPLFLLIAFFLFSIPAISSSSAGIRFSYVGFKFKGVNLTLGGAAHISPEGVLILSSDGNAGQAFYPTPILFKNSLKSVYPFEVYFVCAITEKKEGQEMAFVVSPTMDMDFSKPIIGAFKYVLNPHDNTATYLFNNGTEEKQTVQTMYPTDVRIQVKIIFNGALCISNNVNIDENLPFGAASFETSLSFMNEEMYVGFSVTTGSTSYQLLGWNFATNDTYDGLMESRVELRASELPQIIPKPKPKRLPEPFKILLVVLATTSLPVFGLILAYYINRKLKFSELIEGWEQEYNYISHRFKYKDLYTATKGFKDTELLGRGGFGKVYKGLMPGTNTEIALKKISLDSRQGIKEFIAEIVSLGRLHHRNLVPLLGYCRRKEELMLVDDYMPNGSLEKSVHGKSACMINWVERFGIIKGVASGILYLHEEWEQVVIHRDIKPANVLLDAELNARLGDFGLSRLHAHGSDPLTTKVVGTLGYLAPEHVKTGKATKSSDMYAFGVLLLEVASGRRPIQSNPSEEMLCLTYWVHSLWMNKEILDAMDPNLGDDYSKDEAELVLKLGLFCCHSRPEIRPTMRHIVGYFEDPSAFPEAQFASAMELGFREQEHGFLSPISTEVSVAVNISHSLEAGGR